MNRASERRIGVNWIPMRTDLLSDARVVTLALRTSVTQVTVVGALFVVWSQADAHGVGEHAYLSCPAEAIDVLTGVPGFAAALVEIGWMRPVENGVEFPNYLSHNGSTMKSRLLANRRQARWRKGNTPEFAVDAKRYESNATPSQKRLPQNHTEQKNFPPNPPKGGRPVTERSRPPASQIAWNPEDTWSGISQQDLDDWQAAYPACNIRRQLAAMTQWLKANPAKAKKSAWRRFIANWLSRAQDRGGDTRSNRPAQNGLDFDAAAVMQDELEKCEAKKRR